MESCRSQPPYRPPNPVPISKLSGVSDQGMLVLSWQVVRSRLFGGTAETRTSVAQDLAMKAGGARDKVVTVVHSTLKVSTRRLK
jgi:hypothetical protein